MSALNMLQNCRGVRQNQSIGICKARPVACYYRLSQPSHSMMTPKGPCGWALLLINAIQLAADNIINNEFTKPFDFRVKP